MNIIVKPKVAAVALFSIVGFLTLANATALYVEFGLGKWAFGLVPMFKLTDESNIPTFFSATIWLCASLLMCIISIEIHKKKYAHLSHWIGLSLIGLFLACDEAAQIHEIFDRNRGWTDGLFKPEGALVGPWVVIYGALVLVFIVSYLKFYLALSNRYKMLFGSAGAVFVAGAIGLEIVGAQVWILEGESLMFEVVNSVEEVMEMSGVIIAIYGFLSYINQYFGELRVAIVATDFAP